jgi:hypothetical protein
MPMFTALTNGGPLAERRWSATMTTINGKADAEFEAILK